MITEKQIYIVNIEGDFIRSTVGIGFYRDGVLVAEELVSNRLIEPGGDVSSESSKIRRVANALHVPTLIAKYQAEQEYQQAMENLAENNTPATRKAEVRLKKKRALKRQEYEDFEAS